MNFSEELKKRRESAKLSQREMAKKLGVATRTVSSWETGENTPQPKQRRKIDEILMRHEDAKSGDPVLEVDRSVIIEALLRNVLLQIAKDRAERRGHPNKWKDELHLIDADTIEEMNKIASKLGSLKS
jgi:transcriptional regulator with XRE-family HTH domain